MSKYITYHNHDTKSLLDSCLKVKDLVSWAKANGMSHVGVTNHGEMSSLLELYKECKKQGVKPILGEEFYVTENRLNNEGKKIRDNWHLIVLAKNRTGWDNMTKLHNLSYREDRYYYDPRITLEDLYKHKEGLIITSACIGSVLGRPWANNEIEKANLIAKKLHEWFGKDFYLELQNHNSEIPEEREKQHKYNHYLMSLANRLGIKCVIQNDSHYYLKEHWEAHQVLLCKNTGSKFDNPKFKFDSKEYYLKNEAEMLETFNEYPLKLVEQCFENTSEIASKIEEYKITNDKYDCPVFGEPEESYNKLVTMIYDGLHRKFTDDYLEEHPEYLERLEYEIGVVQQVNFVDYFLMLEDLYKFTSSNGIYMGIGRGSAGGSLALYCLDVIQVDPIKYHLLFERFINVDRVSMCDVDCDVNDKDRPKVIEYLKNRYGVDHVCNIGTYGELTAKASFKAVASVLGIPFDKANTLTSIMDSNMSLKENYDEIDIFRSACQTDDLINRAYKIALVLEGTYAQRGTHACGMVISSKPLDDVCPCVTVKDTKTKERIVSTTFEMKEVDGDLKLLKLDILGLRNLGVIEEADKLIQERHGKHPDYKNLNTEDEKTYNVLSAGYTCGVFQFESLLMQRIIKQVNPTCIEDLSCITALARPGCLDSGLTETFIQRRSGREPVVPFVEGTEKYMEDTLQLPIYQENIMQISRVMAGFSGSEADTLRKYVGKKDPVKLKAERAHFVKGAVSLGHDEAFANQVFDDIEKFGNYGFNKSHAVGYSLLSYATAYYKTNYPIEFMTALLNSVPDDLEKMNLYIGECLRLGISVLPPDINESNKDFTINNKSEIRFGLSAIKGLGKSAVNNIMSARKMGKFTDIINFISRVSKVDKGSLQALLRVGALNTIESHPKRWDKLCDYINDAKNSKYYIETENLEQAVYNVIGSKKAKKSERYLEIASCKRDLGGSMADKETKAELTQEQENIIKIYINDVKSAFLKYDNYKPQERIDNEQELLGFNVSINPYKRWKSFKKFYLSQSENNLQYIELNELIENSEKYTSLDEFQTVGLISEIKELTTRRGQKMAKVTVEYYGAKTTITIFASNYEGDIEFKIKKGNMVSIVGSLIEANKQYSDTDYEIRLNSIRQLNVLINEENKCFIDIDGRDRHELDSIIRSFTSRERRDNLPIERCIIYRSKGKCMVLNGLYWLNSPDKLAKELY